MNKSFIINNDNTTITIIDENGNKRTMPISEHIKEILETDNNIEFLINYKSKIQDKKIDIRFDSIKKRFNCYFLSLGISFVVFLIIYSIVLSAPLNIAIIFSILTSLIPATMCSYSYDKINKDKYEKEITQKIKELTMLEEKIDLLLDKDMKRKIDIIKMSYKTTVNSPKIEVQKEIALADPLDNKDNKEIDLEYNNIIEYPKVSKPKTLTKTKRNN